LNGASLGVIHMHLCSYVIVPMFTLNIYSFEMYVCHIAVRGMQLQAYSEVPEFPSSFSLCCCSYPSLSPVNHLSVRSMHTDKTLMLLSMQFLTCMLT